jgi:hypothetical protein
MPDFVTIANPKTRRVELFQQALSERGLPPAKIVPYADLLAHKCHLSEFDSPDVIFRFDAPERNFAVDRGFIAAGAGIEPTGNHQQISAIAATNLPEDLGRIWYSHQWYLGWCQSLRSWTASLQGRILNHPEDIIVMFDKIRCQRILAAAGIPVPRMLFEEHASREVPLERLNPGTEEKDPLERLCAAMVAQNIQRIFIKLAHGSSASGVVAYELRGEMERAITTVERVVEAGELRFYNSRLIRQYRDRAAITDIIDFLAAESVQVETWLPKARWQGREFDVRVVVIGGKACQAVMRVGNSPMTNLHLGNDRQDIAALPPGLSPQTWGQMLATCERAAACFPRSFYCGIDLLIAPNLQDHYILELNAFGDLLQGITWQGESTYQTQVRLLIQESDVG